jgi:hypothetical protein
VNFASTYPGKGFMYRFNKSTGAYQDVYNFGAHITGGTTSGILSNSSANIGTWDWDESTSTMTLTFSGNGTKSWKFAFGG